MDDTIYMLIYIGRMQMQIGYAVAARESFSEAERVARADGWGDDQLAIIRGYWSARRVRSSWRRRRDSSRPLTGSARRRG